MEEKPRDLSLVEIKHIVNQIPSLNRAALHGIGEPLLNRELVDIITYLKNRKVHVFFNSNALLLNTHWADRLVSSGLDEFRVSLDGASEAAYSKVRGSSNFVTVVKNIEALAQLRRARDRSIPKISVWMVATTENVGDLPHLVQLAARVGIDEVYLQRLVFPVDGPGYGLAAREKAVTDPSGEVDDILRQSMALGRQLGVSLMASGLSSPSESLSQRSRETGPWRECKRPWELAYITAWGNVLPCCISPFSTVDYQSLILGNVFKQPLDEIWQGREYQAFRKMHQSMQPPVCCSGCGVEWSL